MRHWYAEYGGMSVASICSTHQTQRIHEARATWKERKKKRQGEEMRMRDIIYICICI